MKYVIGIIVVAFMLAATPGRAQDAEKVADAEAAALSPNDMGFTTRSFYD